MGATTTTEANASDRQGRAVQEDARDQDGEGVHRWRVIQTGRPRAQRETSPQHTVGSAPQEPKGGTVTCCPLGRPAKQTG